MASSKSKTYFQSFKQEYTKEFPHIKLSSKGEKFAFCEICRCDFSISHAGKYDIARHIKSAKHSEHFKNFSSSSKINTFFKNDTQFDVSQAELLFTSFLIEHNVPLSAADHAGPLFRKMFPDSDIAKKYGCARTKTTALLKEMACNEMEKVTECIKLGPFSAACDGSNDTEHKMYPIVVTFYNPVKEAVQTSLLSLSNLVGDSTGENISKLILYEFERLGVPKENCIAFMADNAAVMQGKKNGVVTHLKNQHQNMIAMGCACHLLNLASEKGTAALPIKIDEILVDIFYYLNKSSKRKESLKHFQELHNKEAQKILKHVCTRWLSLGRSLSRLVNQWEPLLSYYKDAVNRQNHPESLLSEYQIPKKKENKESKFTKADMQNKRKNEDVKGSVAKKLATFDRHDIPNMSSCTKSKSHGLSREENIFMFLSSSENKVYCYFLLYILPLFEKFNVMLQSGSPLIHKLNEMYQELLKELYSKFVKPIAIKNKDLMDVKFLLKETQKDLCDVAVGSAAMDEMKKFTEERKKNVCKNVVKFYEASCNYIVKKFPVNCDVLRHAEVADIGKLEKTKFSNIMYFIDLFPCFLKLSAGKMRHDLIDLVENQFSSLQVEDVSSILESSTQIDTQWMKIGSIKGSNGLPKYKELSEVMLSILLIPHSNAECERIFSIVKKNRTEFRSSLSNKTLENLLVLKTNQSKPCFERVFSRDFLTRAKKATASSLTQECT